jgi:FMN reductase
MLVPSCPLNIVGLSGNLQRPSKKLRALVETVIEHIAGRRDDAVDAFVYDIADVMPELGLAMGGPQLPAKLEDMINRLTAADAIVVGSPVHKGSYTGLFKQVFDLIEPLRLARLPVVLTASGGGDRHALVVEHQLRLLFGFFSSHTVATAMHANQRDAEGRIHSEAVLYRIEAAVSALPIWLVRNNNVKLWRMVS